MVFLFITSWLILFIFALRLMVRGWRVDPPRDIDLKYNDVIEERQYTSETKEVLLEYIWSVINEYLQITKYQITLSSNIELILILILNFILRYT